jgi:hypothetical protein
MTANEAWIQNSLERLEELEVQREQLVAGGQTYRLAEVDEEIATLYETLEAVAADDDAPQQAAVAAVPEMAAHAAASEVVGSPFDAPPAAAATDTGSPFDAPPSAAPPGPMVASPGFDDNAPLFAYDDVDVRPPGSKAPMLLGALLVVAGLGAGGWYVTQQKAAEPVHQPTAGEAKVIDASAIPEDTQEPDAARGGAADRTEGIKIRESSHKPRRGGGSSRPRSASRDSDKPSDKIKFNSSKDDPLGGLK